MFWKVPTILFPSNVFKFRLKFLYKFLHPRIVKIEFVVTNVVLHVFSRFNLLLRTSVERIGSYVSIRYHLNINYTAVFQVMMDQVQTQARNLLSVESAVMGLNVMRMLKMSGK